MNIWDCDNYNKNEGHAKALAVLYTSLIIFGFLPLVLLILLLNTGVKGNKSKKIYAKIIKFLNKNMVKVIIFLSILGIICAIIFLIITLITWIICDKKKENFY